MSSRINAALRGVVLAATLWYLISFVLGSALIPRPHRVFVEFFRLISSGALPLHALASFCRLTAGMIIAVIAALPLGIFAGVSRRTDLLVTPLLYLFYPLPKIAFLPVFMLLFGLGDLSKIILLFSVIFFQLAIAARDSVRNIPAELINAARIMKLDRRQLFFGLYLPVSLPGIFSGLRISIGIGMAVLFFGENYASTWGLGYFIMNSWVMIDYPMMFAGILALGLLAGAMLAALDLLQKRLCPWTGVSETSGPGKL